jgi:hypothetical protein
VLLGVSLVLGADSGSLAQILTKPADCILESAVLLETARLVIDVCGILRVDEKIREDLGPRGVVASQASFSGRALLGFLAGGLRERRGKQD